MNSVTHCKSGYNKFSYFMGEQGPSQINIGFPIPRVTQERKLVYHGFGDSYSPLSIPGNGIPTQPNRNQASSHFAFFLLKKTKAERNLTTTGSCISDSKQEPFK